MQDDHNLNTSESGNVLLIILLAVVLIGALSVAIQGTSSQNAHIDNETIVIRMTEAQRYAGQLERGVAFIMQNGKSESDIRFSHPDADADYGDLNTDTDKSDQVFANEGGGVEYESAPSGINDGSTWEFYGNTALPEVGSDEADLVAVLPNVTFAFCEKVNAQIGNSTIPLDTATCIKGTDNTRISDASQFTSSPNTTNETSFTIKPAMSGCIQCTSGNTYHYFHVLMAR